MYALWEQLGGIMFCPSPSVCLSIHLSFCPSDLSVHRTLKSLGNQVLIEFSSYQFETLHRFCQPIEDMHVTF